MTLSYTARFTEKFWGRVAIGHPDDCWPWTRARKPNSYGITHPTSAQTTGAHQVAYAMVYGAPAPDLDICHRCENPICCNPLHLYAGTPRQNLQDAVRSGRIKAGELAKGARLTEAQAVTILHLRSTGWELRALAQRYGVSHQAIQLLCSGRTWKHLGGAVAPRKVPKPKTLSPKTLSPLRAERRRQRARFIEDYSRLLEKNQAQGRRVTRAELMELSARPEYGWSLTWSYSILRHASEQN